MAKLNLDGILRGERYVACLLTRLLAWSVGRFMHRWICCSQCLLFFCDAGRIPVHYVDPFQAVGIKHNYRREFWAEKGKALSSLRLRKLCTEAFGLIEHIASHRNRRYYAQAILHCDRLNAIFLECLCIECVAMCVFDVVCLHVTD